MHYGLAFALVIPFSQFTLQENKDNTQGKNRRHNNYLGWRKKLRKCLHTLTSTLPTTPASSMVSLKAACSMDSSVSQPPWGQTTHTCQQQHQKGLKINKNWVSKQYKMWRSKQYLWELHSMTLLSTNHKNLQFLILCTIVLVSIRNASVHFQKHPTKHVRLTIQYAHRKDKFNFKPTKKNNFFYIKKMCFPHRPSNNQIKGRAFNPFF